MKPGHFYKIRPLGFGGGTQCVIQFFHLTELATFSRENRLLGKHFHAYTRSTPYVNGRAVPGFTQEKFRGPIPDSNDSVGIVKLATFGEEAGQAKVGILQQPSIANQDIGCFDVSVENTSMMKVIEAFENLLGQIFLMCKREGEGRMVDQSRQIMRQIFEDHETLILLNHNLQEADNIMVAEVLEQLDLAHGRDGKSILFAFHSNLLKCDLSLGVNMNSFEHFAVRACADDRPVARLAVVNRMRIYKFIWECGTGLRSSKNQVLLRRCL